MPRQRKSPSFEHALEELERLVGLMEEGNLSLEESLKAFERGIELSRACQDALDKAQQKVQILSTRNGEAELRPFEQDGN